MPNFVNNSNLGFSTSIPYFLAISEDKDMTITPKIYAGENILIKNEYRQAFENSFLILDSSYTEGYKKNVKEKTKAQEIIFSPIIDIIFLKMTVIIVILKLM